MPAPFPSEQQARFDAELEKILRRYPQERKAAAMIPALRLCQELAGYISPEAMALVSERLEVPPARAREVATFYTMLHTEKPGRYLVELCTNVSCSLCGSESLLAYLEKKLAVKSGHTSADGRFTLREVECLASCGSGPAMQINEEYHERLTPKKIDEILASLK